MSRPLKIESFSNGKGIKSGTSVGLTVIKNPMWRTFGILDTFSSSVNAKIASACSFP